jgi:hypothetical protein
LTPAAPFGIFIQRGDFPDLMGRAAGFAGFTI